jgi:hypothetical protein
MAGRPVPVCLFTVHRCMWCGIAGGMMRLSVPSVSISRFYCVPDNDTGYGRVYHRLLNLPSNQLLLGRVAFVLSWITPTDWYGHNIPESMAGNFETWGSCSSKLSATPSRVRGNPSRGALHTFLNRQSDSEPSPYIFIRLTLPGKFR